MGCEPWINRQGPGDLNENRSIGCAVSSSHVASDYQIYRIEMRDDDQPRSNHRKPGRVSDQTAKLDLTASRTLLGKSLLFGLTSGTLEFPDDVRTQLV